MEVQSMWIVGNTSPYCLTIPLQTDRIKSVGESERLLTAGERGRW
jgi:hypothetical protein